MKRKLFICSLIAVCLSLIAFSTTAYFSHEDNTKSVITAGDVKIDLLEWSIDDTTGEKTPYEDSVGVMPDTTVSKIVEVLNTGSQAAWIRVSVDKDIEFAKGIEGEPDISLLELDFNTEAWYEQDGYFYYLKQIRSGETTEPLLTTVTFSEKMKNEYQNSSATIEVKAQAVQAANNGNTVFEAGGWSKID